MTAVDQTVEGGTVRSLGPIDRGLYALFSRHADRVAHDRDRRRYRAANISQSFDIYVARTYALSWVVFVLITLCIGGLLTVTSVGVLGSAVSFLQNGLPIVNRLDGAAVPATPVVVLGSAALGLVCKRLTIRLRGLYLHWVARARRSDIEQTLPGAVRYLRVLASGGVDKRSLLASVARQDAYGETAVAFQRALNRASLTGSLDEGLEIVARDTPSRDLLSPFLLKFREHANQGDDALEGYLKLEGRMLSQRQTRVRQRTSGYLELLGEVFVVLLVLPALLVMIITIMSVLAPGLSDPVWTPFGPSTVRALLVYASIALVLAVGVGAAMLVATIRPADQTPPTYERPSSWLRVVTSATRNPVSTCWVIAPFALATGGLLWKLGYAPENVVLLGYVVFGVPVGAVAVRRARINDAKNREIKDFVHAVSGHVSLGRPFPEAVRRVASEVDFGALQPDIDALAFDLDLTTGVENEGQTDVRAAALEQFVDRVGTSLARQTVGLVTAALDSGSDAEDIFDTLQAEVGQLYHQRKELRSALLVYVAVAWTTALLVVGIMVAVNGYVLDGFAQLSSVAGESRIAIEANAIDPARDRRRFYLVTQATMLACGWFAGVASRGRYEALLHSGALVGIAYVVFAGAGMI